MRNDEAIQAGHFIEQDTIENFKEAVEKALGRQATFHWPLEFPEVFNVQQTVSLLTAPANGTLDSSTALGETPPQTNSLRYIGGFDAIVCNPPFIGGKKITGILGTSYRDFLVTELAKGARGHADLSAYFFLQAQRLLKLGGHFGMLATNTIAQGDTRERNKDVISPYLNGDDLNSGPNQAPSRFVINFYDWDFERASKYADCLQILTEKVKPYRDTITKQVHEPDYWKFWDKRVESYASIKELGLKKVLLFTISEAARREVLDRLLELNHERYAQEVAEGLHEKGAKKKSKGTKKKKSEREAHAPVTMPSLFSEGEELEAAEKTPSAVPPIPLHPPVNGSDRPLSIERMETSEVMAAFRQSLLNSLWH